MKTSGKWILLFLCAVSALGISQINSLPTAKAERPVTLQHSEIKGDVARSPREAVWLLEPFDPTITRLPKDFSGHNLRVIFQALSKREDIKKDEFETTAEFEQRKRTIETEAVVGNVQPNSLMAFVISNEAVSDVTGIIYLNIDQIASKYDADSKTMNVESKISEAQVRFERNPNFGSLGWGEWMWRNEEYTASNAYGATVKGRRISTSSYGLIVNNLSAFPVKFDTRTSKRGRISHSLSLDVSTARISKDNLAVVAVCRLANPRTMTGLFSTKPTITDPRDYATVYSYLNVELVEYWIFNRVTGEVLLKEKARV